MVTLWFSTALSVVGSNARGTMWRDPQILFPGLSVLYVLFMYISKDYRDTGFIPNGKVSPKKTSYIYTEFVLGFQICTL